MNIVDKIKFEEGDKAKMYKCPAGKWTIGAGINLEAQEMPQEVRDLWLDMIRYKNYRAVDVRLYDAYHIGLGDLEEGASIVLQDMAYQMGVNGLFKFVNMIASIDNHDYLGAADHLLDSNYARQTPERANRNAKLLRGCA
jgi:lysozyme